MKIIYLLSAILLLVGCRSPASDFSQIDFAAGPCFGTCPVFTMTIKGDGLAVYDAESRGRHPGGRFRTAIEKADFDSLSKLIDRADVFALNNKYSKDMTDLPTYFLTVRLRNGKVKTIEDYGPAGPEKLKAVYRFMFSLRQSQDWKNAYYLQ